MATAVTLTIGAAFLVAPRRTSLVLGLGTEPIAARVIGVADAALGLTVIDTSLAVRLRASDR